MKVLTQAVHFKADAKLLDFIQKKLDKLELFYGRVIDAEVYLHVLNTSDKDNKMMELKLRVPGDAQDVHGSLLSQGVIGWPGWRCGG